MLLRRLLPALCVAALFLLPQACRDRGPDDGGTSALAGPGAGGTVESRAPVPLDAPQVLRAASIDGNAETRLVETAPLFIEGFYLVQISPTGLPREHAVPAFRWTAEGEARTWPQAVETELPDDSRLQLVAWLDLNGTGRLDNGDRCSKPGPAPTGETTEPITMWIDRTYVAGTLTATDSVAQTRPVEFQAVGPEVSAVSRAGLVVMGFAASDINESGFPRRETQPTFDWNQPAGPVSWPARVQVPLPASPETRFFAIIDIDDDGRLSPGDHLAALSGPLRLSEDPATPVVFRIDRTLPARAPEGSGGGCGGGDDKPRGNPGDRPGAGPQWSVPTEERRLVVSRGPNAMDAAAGTVVLQAYGQGQIVDGGPPPGVAPAYFWTGTDADGEWPLEMTAPLPHGLDVLVVLDVDGDSVPGPGDWLSQSRPALTLSEDLAAPITFRIERAMPAKAPSEPGGCGGGDRVEGDPGGGPRDGPPRHVYTEERRLVVSRGPDATDLGVGTVVLQAYEPGQLVDGDPPPGVPPTFFWTGADLDGEWPLAMTAPMPPGLDVMVVLDVDGDSMPGPNDWSSEPIPALVLPAVEEPLEAVITRPFAPSGVETVDDLVLDDPEDVQPGGDDDSSVDSAAAVEPPPETLTSLVLDSQPRVPFLRQSTVMVAGYRRADVERSMPVSGARPISFWRSEELQLVWPLEIKAAMPEGATVFLILDLDEDGLPSPGDLSSEPRYDFQPPAEGEKVEFVFQRAYGLADPE